MRMYFIKRYSVLVFHCGSVMSQTDIRDAPYDVMGSCECTWDPVVSELQKVKCILHNPK